MRKRTIEEKANSIIGQFFRDPFSSNMSIELRRKEAINNAKLCVHSILDELGELRNSFKEIYDVCPGELKSKINEMVDLRHEIERKERVG